MLKVTLNYGRYLSLKINVEDAMMKYSYKCKHKPLIFNM